MIHPAPHEGIVQLVGGVAYRAFVGVHVSRVQNTGLRCLHPICETTIRIVLDAHGVLRQGRGKAETRAFASLDDFR